jgi:hypothetical protein
MVIVIRTKGARVGVAHEVWSRSEEGTARPALVERVEMSDWACAPSAPKVLTTKVTSRIDVPGPHA